MVLLPLESKLLAADKLSPWIVYYSNKLGPEAFEPYKLIVLDSETHPLISPLISKGKTVLGYISLGEVGPHQSCFSEVQSEGLLLTENKYWPGNFLVDLRDQRWTKRVIEELIPAILQQGFSGIFLDTLDNAAELERLDSNKYHGMVDAAIRIIETIRRHYPEIKIMLNRGYDLLPYVGDAIDMELGESVFTGYDFDKKRYSRFKSDLYEKQVEILQDAARKFPNLVIYTLDYWNPKDSKGVASIYKAEQRKGFIPYVSTIELDRVLHAPSSKVKK